MTVYATVAEYEAYVGETAPDGLAALLNYSSSLVSAAIRNDLYEAGPNGVPVDDDLREACRDATCIQAAMYVKSGVDPLAGVEGLKPTALKKSIGSGSIEYESMARRDDARAMSINKLNPTAFRVLRNAGLAGAGVTGW